MLWVNSPSNPTGALTDLGAAAAWGRAHGVPVFSDECYVEFTWDGPASTILHHGLDGVVAVHSLSKRSNLAGLRVGFYAGDAELVGYLKEVRKHVGMLVPGPAQAAAAVALADDAHVAVQRDRYRRRLERLGKVLRGLVRASTCRSRPAVSTCGSTPATVGSSPSDWLARVARWSALETSTVPAVRRTCVPPWYNLMIGSSWSLSDWGCCDVVSTSSTNDRQPPPPARPSPPPVTA